MLHRRSLLSQSKLIFHVPCNNSNIDVVTGLASCNGTTSNWTNPLYVLDPTDSSRYVIKKKIGAYYVPVILGLPELLQTTGAYPGFLFSKSQTYTEESINCKFLDSYAGKSHRIEFDVYIYNNTAQRPFYMQGGLWNWNTNAQQNGYEIGIYGSKITVAWRNNVSTTSYTQYYTVAQVAGKWLRFSVDIEEVDATHFKCSSYLKVLDGSLSDLELDTITLTKPTTNNRGMITWFCDHYGSGAWAINNYDYLRDIKIYELQ